MKKFLVRVAIVLLIIGGAWFIWEWRQQTPQEGHVSPDKELLSRCLTDAKEDYDRNIDEADAAPAPDFDKIATETYEKEKAICHDVYGD